MMMSRKNFLKSHVLTFELAAKGVFCIQTGKMLAYIL